MKLTARAHSSSFSAPRLGFLMRSGKRTRLCGPARLAATAPISPNKPTHEARVSRKKHVVRSSRRGLLPGLATGRRHVSRHLSDAATPSWSLFEHVQPFKFAEQDPSTFARQSCLLFLKLALSLLRRHLLRASQILLGRRSRPTAWKLVMCSRHRAVRLAYQVAKRDH